MIGRQSDKISRAPKPRALNRETSLQRGETTGVAIHTQPDAQIALMQLTSAMTYPDLSTAGTSHYTVEPTPFATAKRVWCHQFDSNDKTSANCPLRSYGGTGNSKTETVYHPAARRNAVGYAVGHPAFRAGDRAFCFWNAQSGRWEILSPPLDVWRFELKTALTPGASATAYLLECANDVSIANVHVEFEVFDAIDGGLRGRARSAGTAGALGYAKFMPDFGHWEIIALQHQARWIRFVLIDNLSHYDNMAAAAVLTFWDGYDPDPNNNNVYAINCAGNNDQYLFCGGIGTVGMGCHDPLEDNYRIMQMDPP
jgi:hypothetical protein